MVKLFCTKIDLSTSKDIFNHLLSCLHQAEQEKILKFMRYEHRLRGLLGKLLLFWALNKEYRIHNFPILFYDQNKRPYQKLIQGLDFNISHSGEWAVCALSENGKVGVDVEHIKQINMDISDRYFAEEETKTLNTLPEKDRELCFFHFWTLKEAYIKAQGSTFKIPLDLFWFDISNPEYPKCHFSKDFNYHTNCIFKSYKIDAGYIMSVCADSSNKIHDPIKIEQSNIIHFFPL